MHYRRRLPDDVDRACRGLGRHGGVQSPTRGTQPHGEACIDDRKKCQGGARENPKWYTTDDRHMHCLRAAPMGRQGTIIRSIQAPQRGVKIAAELLERGLALRRDAIATLETEREAGGHQLQGWATALGLLSGLIQIVEEMLPGGGVVVRSIEPGSPASQQPLKANDLITAVDRQSVATLKELKAAAKDQTSLLLTVKRGATTLKILVR